MFFSISSTYVGIIFSDPNFINKPSFVGKGLFKVIDRDLSFEENSNFVIKGRLKFTFIEQSVQTASIPFEIILNCGFSSKIKN